jgi:two-component system sensor histidine kinase KdpD
MSRAVTSMRRGEIGLLAVVTIAAVGLATVAVGLLESVVGIANASAIYLVAVVVTAVLVGTVGAVITSLASFLLYDYLFVVPYHTLTVEDPGEWLSLVLLLFVGIVVGQLTAMQRSRARAAEAGEHEARALFAVSRSLATRDSMQGGLASVADVLLPQSAMSRVWVALGTDEASERIVADTGEGETPVPPALVRVLQRPPGDEDLRWVRIHQPTARGQRGAGIDLFRVRIDVSGTPLGSVYAARERASGEPSVTETRLLASAADQIGQAVAHDRLEADAQAAEIARQSDALKSALLQSVSHDLRTPLATIRAAAGTLRPGTPLSAADQQESVEAIDREVEYLNRLVTNLLDLSRIEAGVLRAELDVFELEDLVGRTLERLGPRLEGHPMDVGLVAPPVKVDPTFLDESVTNILENALKYAPVPAPLRIRATWSGGEPLVRLTLEDGGPGVPPEALSRLFDKFYRVPGAPRGSRTGTGIGLAVVRGLVEAMGGSVSARRSELGGLAVDLDLPAAELPASLSGEVRR